MAEGGFQDPNVWKTQEFRHKIIAKLYAFIPSVEQNVNAENESDYSSSSSSYIRLMTVDILNF